MSLISRFVNTASTAGGNGTTNDTSGANRAYATAQEGETAEETTLIADGDLIIFHCEGSAADTGNLTVTGWTSSETNSITFQVDQSVRHDGKFDTGAYRLEGAGVFGEDVVTIDETNVFLNGIQLEMTSSGSGSSGIMGNVGTSGTLILDSVIVKGSGNGDNIVFRSIGRARNTLSYDAGNDCFDMREGNDAVYNCTAHNGTNGYNSIAGAGNDTCKNCISDTNSNVDYVESGTGTLTNTNCLSSDGTADDFLGSGNLVNKNPLYVNEEADDFHLDPADTEAINKGVDLSEDVFPVTDDIDGDARPQGASFDIGCDEVLEGAGVPPKTMYYYRRRRI